MDISLHALQVGRRSGQEPFRLGQTSTSLTLLGFWQWAHSDLVGNALRGVLAEYIVASALNLGLGTRVEWDAVDLRTPDGLRVEVKSAAYVQTWKQHRLSAIGYDVRPTLGWDAATNESSTERRRHADVYVFCLLHHKDKKTIDPLDLEQWTFYILSSRTLDEIVPTQGRLSHATLMRLEPVVTGFEGLRNGIYDAFGPNSKGSLSPDDRTN